MRLGSDFALVIFIVIFLYHGSKHTKTSTTPPSCFGSTSVVLASARNFDTEFFTVAPNFFCASKPSFEERPLCETCESSHEGARHETMAVSTAHANAQAFSSILPSMPATMASVQRPILRAQAPCQFAAGAELCRQLERTDMGLSAMETESGTANTQNQIAKIASEATECEETTWTRTIGRSTWPTSPRKEDSTSTSSTARDHIQRQPPGQMMMSVPGQKGGPQVVNMMSMPNMRPAVPVGPTMPGSMTRPAPPVPPQPRELDAKFWDQRKSELPPDIQQEITKRKGARVTKDLFTAAQQMSDARKSCERLAKLCTQQFVQHEQNLQERISATRDLFMKAKEDVEQARQEAGEVVDLTEEETPLAASTWFFSS
eukprot:s3207_g3.t1